MTIHPKKDKSSHCNKIKSKSSLKKNKTHSTLSLRKNSSSMTFRPLERGVIAVHAAGKQKATTSNRFKQTHRRAMERLRQTQKRIRTSRIKPFLTLFILLDGPQRHTAERHQLALTQVGLLSPGFQTAHRMSFLIPFIQ